MLNTLKMCMVVSLIGMNGFITVLFAASLFMKMIGKIKIFVGICVLYVNLKRPGMIVSMKQGITDTVAVLLTIADIVSAFARAVILC